MSITAETAKEHLNDKAVFCCRAEEGIVIGPDNLEDPGLFDDLVDSGLLSFPDDALTIGQVLGAKLLKTTDALIPITPSIIDAVQGGEEKAEEAVEEVAEADKEVTIVKVDIDEFEQEAMMDGIRSVPTLIYYRDGKEQKRVSGVHSKEEIIEIMNKYNKN